MANKQTIQELQYLQSLPLDMKVSITKQRLREWVNHWGVDGVYVSFSGGKDSTVLLDIARQMYPNIKAVFVDTGLEYPEIREFVKTYDNVDWIRPKMNFKQVVEKYGYPFISKEVSERIYYAKKWINDALENEGGAVANSWAIADFLGIDRRGKERINYEELAEGKLPKDFEKYKFGLPTRLLAMLGRLPHTENGIVTNEYSKMYSNEKWAFMICGEYNFSSHCCNVMKKNPMHKYAKENGRVCITGEQASESRLRTTQWLHNSCNGFGMKTPKSTPMAFWTEQDVLLYIYENKLPICSVYGDVVPNREKDCALEGQDDWATLGIFDIGMPTLKTTGCKRTGCAFCGFGITHDTDRIANIGKLSNPKIMDYCLRGGAFDTDGLWKPNEEGLGYWFVLKWINIHGNANITIPDFEKYEEKYGNELTKKYLAVD